MWKTIIDLLFPIYCLGCGREGKFICSSCFGRIKMNEKYYFDKADILKKTLVVGYHEDKLLKQAIYRYKYNFIKDLSEPFGQLMIKKIIENLSKKQIKKIILIPIPLHSKRLRWRGFNQAELLAQEISQKLNIHVINDLLIRTKHTLPQAKIQKAFQRRQNIHDVFKLTSEEIDFTNKIILLIDDISTTSATLKEAARILNILKPKQIWGLVLMKD